MLSFCGMDQCSVDSNGRVKLSPRVLDDFNSRGTELVLHCLPEGALAVYPESVYLEMRKGEADAVRKAGESMMVRRLLRRFGAWSQSERISAQGRITLPEPFRKHAGLTSGKDALVVGVEIGIEIWNPERWDAEQRKIEEHAAAKGELEMRWDLAANDAEVKS